VNCLSSLYQELDKLKAEAERLGYTVITKQAIRGFEKETSRLLIENRELNRQLILARQKQKPWYQRIPTPHLLKKYRESKPI